MEPPKLASLPSPTAALKFVGGGRSFSALSQGPGTSVCLFVEPHPAVLQRWVWGQLVGPGLAGNCPQQVQAKGKGKKEQGKGAVEQL